MAASRTPDDEKKQVKNYKHYEDILGRFDLNPAIDEPSPGTIDEKLRKKLYHPAKKTDIIQKLGKAITAATEARRLFIARTRSQPDPTDGHQLRIDLYQALIADQNTW